MTALTNASIVPVMTLWLTETGRPVAEVLDLSPAQREMTLLEYEAARCTACGVRGVETYERDGAAVCALCDVRGKR